MESESEVEKISQVLSDSMDLCHQSLDWLKSRDIALMTQRQMSEHTGIIAKLQRSVAVASKEYRQIGKEAEDRVKDLPQDEQVSLIIDVLRELPKHELERVRDACFK